MNGSILERRETHGAHALGGRDGVSKTSVVRLCLKKGKEGERRAGREKLMHMCLLYISLLTDVSGWYPSADFFFSLSFSFHTGWYWLLRIVLASHPRPRKRSSGEGVAHRRMANWQRRNHTSLCEPWGPRRGRRQPRRIATWRTKAFWQRGSMAGRRYVGQRQGAHWPSQKDGAVGSGT